MDFRSCVIWSLEIKCTLFLYEPLLFGLAHRKHTDALVGFLITSLQAAQNTSTNTDFMQQLLKVHIHLLFSPTSLTTHNTSPFSPKCLLRFAKRCCLYAFFKSAVTKHHARWQRQGGSGKGPSLIGLQTVAACAISVACTITMERFGCDLKVIGMSLCELQSLSHVTLIRCEVTTWDLYDLNRLSFLIWSVWSEIFESMFKGSVQPCSLIFHQGCPFTGGHMNICSPRLQSDNLPTG